MIERMIQDARRRAEELGYRKAAQYASVSTTFLFALCKRGPSYAVLAFFKVAGWLGYSLQKDKSATVETGFRDEAETAHVE